MSVDGDTILSFDDWLLKDGVKLEVGALVDAIGHRLTAVGLPLDRFGVSIATLNPSMLAAGIFWRPCEPMQFTRFDYARRDSGMYENSPLKVAHETGRWVELALDETPDETFGIVPDLKAEGLRHYMVVPVPDSIGNLMSLTFASKSPEGFSADHREIIQRMLPAVTAVLEIKTLRSTFRDVLGAYVGKGPAAQIISGSVHRGQVMQVRAAIYVADLRGFTHLSTQLPPEATADLINRYYDIVVPPLHERGGEVLKFIGDAVLAIFPTGETGDDEAVLKALDAGRTALDDRVPPYEVAGRKFDIRFGVAVHVGEAVYGNVGSGDRLDFTVIGRDVNIAARIAALCSTLGRDYLVSEEVADIGKRHGRLMASAGRHEVRGLEKPLPVYVPDASDPGPIEDDGVSQGLSLATIE